MYLNSRKIHYKIIVKRLQKLEVEETPRYTQHYNTGTERSVCWDTKTWLTFSWGQIFTGYIIINHLRTSRLVFRLSRGITYKKKKERKSSNSRWCSYIRVKQDLILSIRYLFNGCCLLLRSSHVIDRLSRPVNIIRDY